jgi:GTP cyclohydrolase II
MRAISSGDRLRALIDRDSESRPAEPPTSGTSAPRVRVVAVAELPTRFGAFHLVAFQNDRDGNDHLAMVHGDVIGAEDLPTRVHSECLTGDVMGSLRCDCREQLEEALRLLARQPRGLLLYLRQEGRGIGLVNKLRAYALQEQGLDTVEANLALGFRDDERDYAVAAAMLEALGVESIQLMTNNPQKLGELTRHGVRVTGRIAHAMPPNAHNRFYLETKARRSGHLLDLRPESRVERAPRTLAEARLLD